MTAHDEGVKGAEMDELLENILRRLTLIKLDGVEMRDVARTETEDDEYVIGFETDTGTYFLELTKDEDES